MTRKLPAWFNWHSTFAPGTTGRIKAGDKKTVYLTAESGLTNEDFIFEVIVDEVRAALKEEILLGYPVKLTVQKCEDRL